MVTVNGKLINQERDRLDELTQRTEKIIRRCESLESQVSALTKQDYTQYLQKVSYEVNNVKTFLQKLDKRIGFLEELTSSQAKELLFFKISNVIGLGGLLFMLVINHLPEFERDRPQKRAESVAFIQQKLK
ncbi:hypothetical protein F7734_34830 [Scytonema sp. UIC 10036]|uniref:hypothetical protein n=1 Tax=Scytonema sp. UIC 10036 TaxID=2304196 RepID=UPI0012DAE00E|nr:hypothetical protein [Scytonema sp. UIC 10036]MUG97232.1 hypothetical protein [Scytonema sp. UIC 10036]